MTKIVALLGRAGVTKGADCEEMLLANIAQQYRELLRLRSQVRELEKIKKFVRAGHPAGSVTLNYEPDLPG